MRLCVPSVLLRIESSQCLAHAQKQCLPLCLIADKYLNVVPRRVRAYEEVDIT